MLVAPAFITFYFIIWYRFSNTILHIIATKKQYCPKEITFGSTSFSGDVGFQNLILSKSTFFFCICFIYKVLRLWVHINDSSNKIKCNVLKCKSQSKSYKHITKNWTINTKECVCSYVYQPLLLFTYKSNTQVIKIWKIKLFIACDLNELVQRRLKLDTCCW